MTGYFQNVEIKTNVKMNLNPNIKIVWSLNYVFALLVVFTLFYAFEVMTGKWEEFIDQYLLHFIFLLIFTTFVFLFYIELKYKSHYYMLTESEIVFRKGILNTVKHVVPFRDIQNLNIEKNLLERLLGIINLRIETAGSNAIESEILIPGIENEDDLTHKIRKRMEEIKGMGKTREEIKLEVNEVKESENKLEKKFVEMDSKYDALSKKIEKKSIEIDNLKEEISSVSSELKTTHSAINKLSSSIHETNMKMDALGKIMIKKTIEMRMSKQKTKKK